MTTKTLKLIALSRPKTRVGKIALCWIAAAALKLLRLLFKPLALPFLWCADRLYDTERCLQRAVGDIIEEDARKRIEEDKPDDDWSFE